VLCVWGGVEPVGGCDEGLVRPVGRVVRAKREGEAPPLARVRPTAAQLLRSLSAQSCPTGGPTPTLPGVSFARESPL
jgi:hypothetical protein